ncbi:hypothetical protein D3C72_1707180 [compost metagenome]
MVAFGGRQARQDRLGDRTGVQGPALARPRRVMHRLLRLDDVQEQHAPVLDLAQHHGLIDRVAQGRQPRTHQIQPGIARQDQRAQAVQLRGRVIARAPPHLVHVAPGHQRAHQRQAAGHGCAQALGQLGQRHRPPRLREQFDQIQRACDKLHFHGVGPPSLASPCRFPALGVGSPPG